MPSSPFTTTFTVRSFSPAVSNVADIGTVTEPPGSSAPTSSTRTNVSAPGAVRR